MTRRQPPATGAVAQPPDQPEQSTHDLLTQIEGVGPDLANRLLLLFGSGREVAKAACRYWGELAKVDGVSEEMARSMFDRMQDAGVYEDLREGPR